MLPVPAALEMVLKIRDRLDDPTMSVDAFTLRGYVRDLDRELRTAPPELRGGIFGLLGACYARLDNLAEATTAFRNAAHHEPAEAKHEMNLAAVCALQHDYPKALEHIRKARAKTGLDPMAQMILDCNEAEIFQRLGDHAKARGAFEVALARFDPTPQQRASGNLRLARSAATLGYEYDATEFFARYLLEGSGASRTGDRPATEVIESLPEQAAATLRHLPELAGAVKRVLAEQHEQAANEIKTRFVIGEDGWDRVRELAGIAQSKA
jgi:tetratricopeptide (TPR) repeat protein